MHKGLTRQFPAETSNVTGILNQLSSPFLSRACTNEKFTG